MHSIVHYAHPGPLDTVRVYYAGIGAIRSHLCSQTSAIFGEQEPIHSRCSPRLITPGRVCLTLRSEARSVEQCTRSLGVSPLSIQRGIQLVLNPERAPSFRIIFISSSIYNFVCRTSTILSPISFVDFSPPKSLVLRPNPPISSASRTFRTEASTARASFSKPREYRRSIAKLRMVPIGLAMPCPAISGADPWIGSYNPEHRLPFSGAPANEAEGRRPREPGMTLLSSDNLSKRAGQYMY